MLRSTPCTMHTSIKHLVRIGLITALFIGFQLSLQCQDFGTEDQSDNEPMAGELQQVRLVVKLRPVSYLLFPLTSGNLGSFNGELEFGFRPKMSASVGWNYFFISKSSQFLPDSGVIPTDMFSLRCDVKYYFPSKKATSALTGFFFGPYYKLRFTTLVDRFPNPNTGLISETRHGATSQLVGLLGGYQMIKGRFVLSPAIGLGTGITTVGGAFGYDFDFRLGLSMGFVVF